MNRLIVIILLAAIMAGVSLLAGSVDSAVIDTLTFAAVGFVILAAGALAEIGQSWKLPRVTGYIVAGIAAGPQVSAILSPEVVEQLKVFNTLALALIALEAGLELRIDAVRRVAKSLGSMVALKIPLSWLVVGGVFMLAAPLMPGGSALSMAEKLGIALMLGALSVGTSPAVSVAVISEMRATGKLAELILAIAVAKDVVMIVMLAIGMAVAEVLISPGAELGLAVFTTVAVKVVGSLAVGAVLGGLLIAWMRWVRWELLIVLLVLGYGVNAVADLLHLKMLLIFISAGFTVTNFSPYGHDLHKPLALLAMPVFIVFFTTVGAGLDLQAAWAVLPLGLILFAARAGMLAVSSRVGAHFAGDSPAFGKAAWFGFVSQAGVALGLLLIAQEQVPALAGPLGQVATVLISLNLIIGPIMLRKTLAFKEPEAEGAESGPAEALPGPQRAVIAPNHPELAAVLGAVDAMVDRLVVTVEEGAIRPWETQAVARLAATDDPSPSAAPETVPVEPAADILGLAVRGLRDDLDAIPESVSAKVVAAHRVIPHRLGLRRTLRARLWRLFHPEGRRLVVPTGAAVRTRVEGAVVPAMAAFLRQMARLEAERVARVGAILVRRSVATESTGFADADAQWITDCAGGLRATLDTLRARVHDQVAEALLLAGTPSLPARDLRFSKVAAEVDAASTRIASEGPRWDRALSAVAGRAGIATILVRMEATLRAEVKGAVHTWRSRHADLVIRRIDRLSKHLRQIRTDLVGVENTPDVIAPTVAALQKELDRLIGTEILPGLREAQAGEGVAASLGAIAERMRSLIEDIPESVRTAPSGANVASFVAPEDVPATDVPLQALTRQHLQAEIAWLEDARADAEHFANRAIQRVGEVAGVTLYSLELAQQMGAEQGAAREYELSLAAIDRATRLVNELASELEEAELVTALSIDSTLTDALDQLRQHIQGTRSNGASQHRLHPKSFGRGAASAYSWLVSRTTKLWESGRRTFRRAATSELARDVRVRAGVVSLTPEAMSRDLRRLGVTVEQAGRVPYVLAQLFDDSTFDLAQAPVRTKSEVEHLESVWRRWETGTPTALLLTGASGSGKTALAMMTLRKAIGRQSSVVALTPVARTEAGLAAAIGTAIGTFDAPSLESLEGPLIERAPVLLVDGLERAFTRTPEGLAHIRAFLRLLAATRHRVCWVVSVVGPAARLLDRSVDLQRWFTDHVHLEPLDVDALAAVVEARCRLSGFSTTFPKSGLRPDRPWSRIFRGLRGTSPEERRRTFYQDLHEASGGHVRDALMLWMNAVERVDNETLILKPIEAPSLAWFDQLGRRAHHLLALAVVTGQVSRQDAIEALGWPAYQVDATLAVLEAARILRRGQEGRVRIWPPAWRRIAELLIERRMLIPPTAERPR